MVENYTKFCQENGFSEYIGNENLVRERKIKEFENLILEILEMLSTKVREKRSLGLLKYVGTVAKYLFGILDEEDKNYFDQKIEKLDTADYDILSLLENQTQIVKSKFLICDDNFNHYNDKLKTIEILIKNETLYRKNYFLMELIDRYIIDFEMDAYTLIDAIIFANSGQLHPRLITHRNIKQLTDTIKLTESDYDVPFSDTPTIIEISKISKLAIYYNNDKIKYVIDIPLLDKEIFTLFKHYSLPHPLKNSSLFTYIFPTKKFSAINSDHDKYISFEENDLNSCIKTGNKFFCETSPVNTINKDSSCEIKILIHSNINTNNTCDIRLQTFKHPLFQKLLKPNTWLYSVPTNTQLNIICKNSVFNEILNGSGILQLEPQCKAKTELISLKTTKVKNFVQTTQLLERFSKNNFSLQSSFEMPDLKLTKILEKKNNLNYNTQNLEKSDNLIEISEKITALKTKNRLEIIENNQSLLKNCAMTIAALIITCLFAYIAVKNLKRKYLCCFRMKSNPTNDIPMIRIDSTNPNTFTKAEDNSTQTKVTCFPRTLIKRETAHSSETADNLEFTYEKKVEI